jgi:hypothetical protein
MEELSLDDEDPQPAPITIATKSHKERESAVIVLPGKSLEGPKAV